MLYCVFLLLFFSCSRQGSHWEITKTPPSKKGYSPSGYLCFYSNAIQSNRLSLRLTQGTYGKRLYAESFGLTLPSFAGDESKAVLTIRWDNEEEKVVTHRFQGGHRLLLSEETTQKLITALLNHHSFKISCGRCHGEITSTDFANSYANFR